MVSGGQPTVDSIRTQHVHVLCTRHDLLAKTALRNLCVGSSYYKCVYSIVRADSTYRRRSTSNMTTNFSKVYEALETSCVFDILLITTVNTM